MNTINAFIRIRSMLLTNIDECEKMGYLMSLIMFYLSDHDAKNIINMMDNGVVA